MPLYLLGRIDDEPVAIATNSIASVIRPGPLTPVPRAPVHVAGLCALRSRVLTVVDACAAIGRGSVRSDAPMAVVIDIDGHGYAILMDGIDDVIEASAASPCSAALAACWRAVSIGTVTHGDGILLLIDPGALVEGRALAA